MTNGHDKRMARLAREDAERTARAKREIKSKLIIFASVMVALFAGGFGTSLFWLDRPEPPVEVVRVVGLVSQFVGFFVGGYLAPKAIEQDGYDSSLRAETIAKLVADIFLAAISIQLLQWATGEIEHSWYYYGFVFVLQILGGVSGCSLYFSLHPWLGESDTPDEIEETDS